MANLLDAQAAHESIWHLWPAVMAHSNMVMHSCGWLEGGLTASFEKFVMDAESLGDVARFFGAEVGREQVVWGVEMGRWGDGEMGLERANRLWKGLLERYAPPPMDVALRDALGDFVARRTSELQGANLYEYE